MLAFYYSKHVSYLYPLNHHSTKRHVTYTKLFMKETFEIVCICHKAISTETLWLSFIKGYEMSI